MTRVTHRCRYCDQFGGHDAGCQGVATDRIAQLEAELAEAWRALGTTAEDATDDLDTAALADSIRVSIQYERDQATAAREERDAANAQRERGWHRANEAEKARDAALADLSQARAELEESEKEGEHALKQLDKALTERDAAVKRAEAAEVNIVGEKMLAKHAADMLVSGVAELRQLREENARLSAECNARHGAQVGLGQELNRVQALLGRAVAALQEAKQTEMVFVESPVKVRIVYESVASAILADASSAQALDAWRAQQEEHEAVNAFIKWKGLRDRIPHAYQEEFDALVATAAEVDARRGQGGT